MRQGPRIKNILPQGRQWLWALACALLLLPLAAMAVGADVHWEVGDFIFAALLILAPLGFYEILAQRIAFTYLRRAYIIIMAATVLMLWAQGAVGIIGDGSSAPNRLYLLIGASNTLGFIGSWRDPRYLIVALIVSATLTILGLYWARDAAPVVLVFHLILLLTWLGGAYFIRKSCAPSA